LLLLLKSVLGFENGSLIVSLSVHSARKCKYQCAQPISTGKPAFPWLASSHVFAPVNFVRHTRVRYFALWIR